jgi:hypothetical protein
MMEHFKSKPTSWITEPLFFHRNHQREWTNDYWGFAKSLIETSYRITLSRTNDQFRSQFPRA